jgi:hypothetical protein
MLDIARRLAVLLQPLERWEGPLGAPQLVDSGADAGSRGFPFEVGLDYPGFCTLIHFGITCSPAHFTHLCARTSPLDGNPAVSRLPAPARHTAR